MWWKLFAELRYKMVNYWRLDESKKIRNWGSFIVKIPFTISSLVEAKINNFCFNLVLCYWCLNEIISRITNLSIKFATNIASNYIHITPAVNHILFTAHYHILQMFTYSNQPLNVLYQRTHGKIQITNREGYTQRYALFSFTLTHTQSFNIKLKKDEHR